MTKTIKEVLEEYFYTGEHKDCDDSCAAKYKEDANVNEALSEIEKIMDGVIGENQSHAPVENLGIWSHDIARYEYNHLRKRQRQSLKEVLGE